MILVAHQPNHLPYPGFFNKMMQSDVFVLTDSNQFSRNNFHNRNRIRTKDGYEWITVPVFTKGHPMQAINETIINDGTNWRKKHWRKLLFIYGRSPFFKNYSPFFERLYAKKWENLAELNIELILYLLKELSIDTRIELSSDLGECGRGTDFLVNVNLKLGADTYLSGPGGRNYIEEQKFADNGIKLVYQEYRPTSYRQLYQPFMPDVSVIDMFFNLGSDRSKEVILNSKRLNFN